MWLAGWFSCSWFKLVQYRSFVLCHQSTVKDEPIEESSPETTNHHHHSNHRRPPVVRSHSAASSSVRRFALRVCAARGSGFLSPSSSRDVVVSEWMKMLSPTMSDVWCGVRECGRIFPAITTALFDLDSIVFLSVSRCNSSPHVPR